MSPRFKEGKEVAGFLGRKSKEMKLRVPLSEQPLPYSELRRVIRTVHNFYKLCWFQVMIRNSWECQGFDSSSGLKTKINIWRWGLKERGM